MEESKMDRKELAYVKQTIFAVRDWDAFQAVLRTWARLVQHSTAEVCAPEVKKI